MGLKLYEETSVQAIADAIRAKNGSSDTYTISEMSAAIENIPSGGEGGTHTETKTLTFLNTTTPFNVGEDFLSGYGVYPQDSSYALAIAVSDGVGFAARLHNGVADGYSASCTYSDGVFTFDSAFVQNYMGSSVYSLDCLFNDGESDLYKYHWSQDGKICVREEIGAVKWFFMGLTKDSDDIEVPTELVSYLPDFETPEQYMSSIAFTDPEGAWDGYHYIGFVYPGTANVKIRSWYSSNLGGGTFWGVLDITHYPFANQRNEYIDPTDA